MTLAVLVTNRNVFCTFLGSKRLFSALHAHQGWTLPIKGPMNTHLYQRGLPLEGTMAQKRIERKKELDRRRKRREERLKQRVREAKAAKA